MEKMLQNTKFPRIVLVPLGIALVVFSYWLAGGYDRSTPMYGQNYGCNFGAIDKLTYVIPPKRYSHYELLGCLPPYYFLLYALAILGVIMCGWALVMSGKRLFHRGQIQKEDFVNGIVALIVSPLMILAGVWMLHLRISFGFGGGVSSLGDLFETVSEALIIMGLLVIIFAVILAFVAELKGKSIA